MNEENPSCVVVMMKYPRSGNVKTRLARDIGDERALEIYMAMINDTIDMVLGSSMDAIIALYPLHEHVPWEVKIPLIGQRGKDLGERQYNATMDVFSRGYSKVILIPVDCPDIDMDIISLSTRALDQNDAVIGPSEDGGYYLLGANRGSIDPGWFEGVEWGTGKVFGSVLENMKSAGISVEHLDDLNDIDTMEDLLEYAWGKTLDGINVASVVRDWIEEGVIEI